MDDLRNSTYEQEIEKFYEKGKEGFFTGKAGIKIYYKIFEKPNSTKAIFISSGRTEAAIKYKELIYDLNRIGYAIYIHDHRGQGLSGRMLEDREMGFVDSFQYYIDDMKYFYENFMDIKKYDKTYLLAHSMGGAIGMTYLEQFSTDFDAAAFSSPMLGFNLGICTLANKLKGDKPKFAVGQSGYKDLKNNFDNNDLTGSKIRYEIMVDAYGETPEARLGGVTYSWLSKSCEQFEYLFNNIFKIQTPFILFSAEDESIVDPDAHFEFVRAAQKLNKKAFYIEIEDAKHELFIEKDQQRIKTLNQALNFFSHY